MGEQLGVLWVLQLLPPCRHTHTQRLVLGWGQGGHLPMKMEAKIHLSVGHARQSSPAPCSLPSAERRRAEKATERERGQARGGGNVQFSWLAGYLVNSRKPLLPLHRLLQDSLPSLQLQAAFPLELERPQENANHIS